MSESIAQIKAKLDRCDISDLDAFMTAYAEDERDGVKKLVLSANKKKAAYEKECIRIEKMLTFEREHGDCHYICGVDEAGRGPLAGPVVAAAVILDPDYPIFYANDSKQLSEKKREALFEEIMDHALYVGVGIAEPELIDEINILQADYAAMRDAIAGLGVTPDLLLNDAVIIPGIDTKQISIIKGDARSLSIACASIIAKVTRDRLMKAYDEAYPEYHFLENKGYGTAVHIEALKKYGPCPIHRRSFIGHFVEV